MATTSTDPPALRDLFYEIFTEFYSDEMSAQLADSHADAHGQFTAEFGIGRGGPRKKGVKYSKDIVKKPVRVRMMESELQVGHRAPIRKAPNVVPDDIDDEVLSFMLSVNATEHSPYRLKEIVEGCSGFGWTYAQIRISVRRLQAAGKIIRHGNYKSSEYSLAIDTQVSASVPAKRLQTEHPADGETYHRQADAYC